MLLFFFTFITLFLNLTICQGGFLNRRADRVCNGHAEFCNRSYGNLTTPGAHDSYAFSTDVLAYSGKNTNCQHHSTTTAWFSPPPGTSTYEFWRASLLSYKQALFDGGTVQSYLDTVKQFMDDNPNEVLTLLFTNPEGASVSTVWDPIFEASGVKSLAYVPPKPVMAQSDWPTLNDMIDSGKRVVVFMDADSNQTIVPYILSEFPMIWEAPFDSTNSSFPCSVDRSSGPLGTGDHMSLINHYLDFNALDTGILIPNEDASNTTNSVQSILADSNGCAPLNGGRNVNFVLLDWVDFGNISGAIAILNGVQDTQNGVGRLLPPLLAVFSTLLFILAMNGHY